MAALGNITGLLNSLSERPLGRFHIGSPNGLIQHLPDAARGNVAIGITLEVRTIDFGVEGRPLNKQGDAPRDLERGENGSETGNMD